MKRLTVLLLISTFAIFTGKSYSQSEFKAFLDLHSLSPVPFVYQSRVVPGAIVTHSGISSSYPGLTNTAKAFNVIDGQSEQAKTTISVKNNRSLILSILKLGGGVGYSGSDDLEIDEATVTCKSVDESDMDTLVYTDPDFARKIRPYLGNATPYLIESVCWATSLTATETSSKQITAAFGDKVQSCDAKAGTPPSNGSPKAGTTPPATKAPASTPGSPAKNGATTSTVLETISKDTVGDLDKALQGAAKSAASAATADVTVQGQYCINSENRVALNAKTPVAIALKLWKVENAINPVPDNKNKLDYEPWVDSLLK
jgi:hypothetical protein